MKLKYNELKSGHFHNEVGKIMEYNGYNIWQKCYGYTKFQMYNKYTMKNVFSYNRQLLLFM